MDLKKIFCAGQRGCPFYAPCTDHTPINPWSRNNIRCEYLDNDRFNRFQEDNWVCINICVPKKKRKVSVVSKEDE